MADETSPEVQNGIIEMFVDATGAPESVARRYLEANEWNYSAAATSYYDDQDEDDEPAAGSSSHPAPVADQEYTGPRTLDGRPAPQSALPSSSSSKKPARRTGVATLGSLGGGSGHDHSDDDDDDDDDPNRRGDLFAGGEKSGLAVQDPARNRGGADRGSDAQNPQSVIKDILAKAKANAKQASEEDSPGPSRPSNFRGGGVTVGGEGTESRRIPNARAPAAPAASRSEDLPVVTRTLHLWRDGFSIEDGPLRRFSDPEHAMDLQMIRSGRAPLHLMDVEHGQRCDVRLQQHEEDWHQLPRIYRPFGGQGRRLGSPVPGESSGSASSAPAQTAPAAVPTTSSTQSASASAAPTNVDSSQPTVAIRFQMPDGSRLPARFNLSNTIGDLYQFAANTAPEMRTRQFIIQSTFPSKEYTDKEQKLEEIDAFKKGGIAFVKWAST